MFLKKIAAITSFALLGLGISSNLAIANEGSKTIESTIECKADYRQHCRDHRYIYADAAAGGEGWVFIPNSINYYETVGFGKFHQCRYKFHEFVTIPLKTAEGIQVNATFPTMIDIVAEARGHTSAAEFNNPGKAACKLTVTAKKLY